MYDSTFEVLKTKFLDSFKDKHNFELIEINIDTPNFSQDATVQSKFGGGLEIWKSRLTYILQIIETSKEGEVFLFSDVDIVFYNPLLQAINDVYIDQDIVFLREVFDGIYEPQSGNINFGFNMIRCSPKTHRFFSDILLKVIDTGLWEQLLINHTLYSTNDYNLNWSLFPPSFFSSSVGLHRLNTEIKNIVLYHANAAVTVDQKLGYMHHVNLILRSV